MLKGITFEGSQTAPNTMDYRLEDDFERVFKTWYKSLHAYACTLLRDTAAAEETVQTIFVRLWEKREEIVIREKLSSYLYRAVHNESMNVLKQQKRATAYQSHVMRQPNQPEPEKASEKVRLTELQEKIEEAMNALPEQCRIIFQLSRFEELKYKEIADRLDLSVKTVENQMGKALKLMRLRLLDFLVLLLILFIHLTKCIQ